MRRFLLASTILLPVACHAASVPPPPPAASNTAPGIGQCDGTTILCTNNNGTTIFSAVVAGAVVGTSPTNTAPHALGDPTTGYYSAGPGLMDVSASGTQLVEFSSNGVNIVPITAALEFAGTTVFHEANAQYREITGEGARACQQFNAASTGGNGMLCNGPSAGQFAINTSGESVLEGAYTGQFSNLFGQANWANGEHNQGHTDGSYLSSCGQDNMRDTILDANVFSCGAQATDDGFNLVDVVSEGAFALAGAAGAIQLGATNITAGDKIIATATSPNPDITGGLSATYTVQAGDNLASVTAGLANKISALALTVNMANPVGHILTGNTEQTENGVKVEASVVTHTAGLIKLHYPQGGTIASIQATQSGTLLVVNSVSAPAGVLLPSVNYGGIVEGAGLPTAPYELITGWAGASNPQGGPGTYTTTQSATVSTAETMTVLQGWNLTWAITSTGSGTYTGTVTGVTGGQYLDIGGANALSMPTIGVPMYDTMHGDSVCEFCTSNGSTQLLKNTVYGAESAQNLFGAQSNNIFGYNIANSLSTGIGNNIFCSSCAGSLSTGNYNGIYVTGGSPNAGGITTGAKNFEIGFDAMVPSPTGTGQLSLQNLLYMTNTADNGTLVSATGLLGIGQNAPGARLDVSGNGTSTELAFRLTNSAGTTLMTMGDTGVLSVGTGAASANGTVATVLGSLGPTGSHVTVQEWLTYTDAAGNVRYVPSF